MRQHCRIVVAGLFSLIALALSAWAVTPTDLVVFNIYPGSGSNRLYLMDADGSQAAPISSATNDTGANWSPDGTQIAFTRDSLIYKMAPATASELTQVSPSTDRGSNATFSYGDLNPDWSPDGGTLVYEQMFMFNRNGQPDHGIIKTMGAVNGWNQRVLLDGSKLTPHRVFDQPHYSPDGKMLTFGMSTNGSEQIWVCVALNCAGTLKQLTNYTAAGSPWWWPDGSKVMFEFADVRATSGSVEIGTVPVNAPTPGTGAQTLTHFSWPQDVGEPSISSDGTKIIFSLADCSGFPLGDEGACFGAHAPATIWRMNADGTDETNTGQPCAAAGGSPRYQPQPISLTDAGQCTKQYCPIQTGDLFARN